MTDTAMVQRAVERLRGPKYQEPINGTSYHSETNPEVVRVLEFVRLNQTRIVVSYGDVLTGRDWNDRYGMTGRIGRSTGTIKIPLVIANSRCCGGGAMLDNCIVKIVTSKGKRVLYQHPTYHQEAE